MLVVKQLNVYIVMAYRLPQIEDFDSEEEYEDALDLYYSALDDLFEREREDRYDR